MADFNDITMDDINGAGSDTGQDPGPVTPEPAAPAEPAPPVAPAAPAAPATTHPWDTRLAELGLEPEHQAAVSEYLAKEWQPRMTQFEQDLKEWQDSFGGSTQHRDLGANLISAFQDDPETAFIQLGVELGMLDPEDLGEGWEHFLEGRTDEPPANDDSRLTAEEKEILAWARDQMGSQKQEESINTLHAYYHDLANEHGIAEGFDLETFDIMFGGAMGDVDKAVALYKAVQGGAQAPTPPPAVETAPPVLDDHTGGQAPPEAEHYTSFEEAGKAMLAEARAKEGR